MAKSHNNVWQQDCLTVGQAAQKSKKPLYQKVGLTHLNINIFQRRTYK